MLAMNHSTLVMKLKMDEKTDVGEEAEIERENEMAGYLLTLSQQSQHRRSSRICLGS